MERFLGDLDPAIVLMDPTKDVPVLPDEAVAVSVILDDVDAARKVEALRRQASQTTSLIETVGLDAYVQANSVETYRHATDEDWPDGEPP